MKESPEEYQLYSEDLLEGDQEKCVLCGTVVKRSSMKTVQVDAEGNTGYGCQECVMGRER